LFSQAEAMTRHYELVCLLVEFSPQRPFCLQGSHEIPPEIQVR
jgi:ERCC4-type nuclease